MKIKENYKLREIAGENLIVDQGASQADMTKVISLNGTALVLWNEFQGKDFAQEDVEQALIARFNISQEVAQGDARTWVDSLVGCGVIAE